MIRVEKVLGITRDNNGNIVAEKVEAIADTKAEVTGGGQFVGLPENCTVDFGSTVCTASFELGFMQSNGVWKWS